MRYWRRAGTYIPFGSGHCWSQLEDSIKIIFHVSFLHSILFRLYGSFQVGKITGVLYFMVNIVLTVIDVYLTVCTEKTAKA